MRYYISDPHFGHKNIIKLDRPNFETILEHDQFIIDSVNKIVKVTDELWILGDIGNPQMLRYLNGTKTIILGNHDKRSIKEYQAFVKDVYTTPVYINKRLVASHEPEIVENHILNVHGHLHGAVLDLDNYLNTSIEVIDYTPVSEKELQRIVSTLPKERKTFLDEWYAEYYKFTQPKDGIIMDSRGRIDIKMTKLIIRDKHE